MTIHDNTWQCKAIHELEDHILEKASTSCTRIGAAMDQFEKVMNTVAKIRF
jgi:hypothetical protein